MKKHNFTYPDPNLVFNIFTGSYHIFLLEFIRIIMDPRTVYHSIGQVLYMIVRLEISDHIEDGVLLYIRLIDLYLLMVGMVDHGTYQLQKIEEGPTVLPFGESYGDLGGLDDINVGLGSFKKAIQDLLCYLRERIEWFYTNDLSTFDKWKDPIKVITVFVCEALRNYMVCEDVSGLELRAISPWSTRLILNWEAVTKSAFDYSEQEGDFLTDEEVNLMYGKPMGNETLEDLLGRLKANPKVCYFMIRVRWNFRAKSIFERQILKLLGGHSSMSLADIAKKLKPDNGCVVIPGQIKSILWELTNERKIEINDGMYRRPRKNKGKEILTPVETVEEHEAMKKPHVSLVLFGPRGSGKTTLARQILHETRKNTDTTMEENQNEISYFETKKKRFTMFDVGGCKSRIPEMARCASQADLGVLVISSVKEEYERTDVQELVALAQAMGLQSLLIVINKMDMISWSYKSYHTIKSQVRHIVRSLGFNIEKDVDFIPICGLHGMNLTKRVGKNTCEWSDDFRRRSMLDVLDDHEVPLRYCDSQFRMPISYKLPTKVVFTGHVEPGWFLLGKVMSGNVKKGNIVFIMPKKVEAQVSKMIVNQSEVRSARARDNLRVVVPRIEETEISPGYVLCDTYRQALKVKEFIAELLLPKFSDETVVNVGYKSTLHIHSAVVECEILMVEVYTTGKEIVKQRPFVKNGEVVRCRLKVEEEICIDRYTAIRELGCFALRTQGKTVAVGTVTELCLVVE